MFTSKRVLRVLNLGHFRGSLVFYGALVGPVGQARPMFAIIRNLRYFDGGSVGQAPPFDAVLAPFDAVWRRLTPFDGPCFFRGAVPFLPTKREII